MQKPIRCFISYAHVQPDDAFAEYLYDTLTEWGYKPWLDIHDIPKGISEESTGWIDSIDKGLQESDVLIGLVSPISLKRHNVVREWKWALLNNMRIFFIRLEDYDSRAMSHQFIEAIYIEKDRLIELKDGLNTVEIKQSGKINNRQREEFSLNEEILRDLEQLAKAAALVKQDDALIGSANPNKHDELIFRDRVRRYWLETVLKPSLQDETSFNIGLALEKDAVASQNQAKNLNLSGSIDIYKSYKALEENFLILGEPGSGKTILLLELATGLLLNEKLEMPLIVNLSSWEGKKFWEKESSFEDWLFKEAERSYRIRAAAFRRWLADKKLILLLDGFDEIPEAVRAEKIIELNRFHKANPDIPLVVCSRSDEYRTSASQSKNKLDFENAIRLEALSEKQIRAYLAHPELAALEQLYETDVIVRGLMKIPFLLSALGFTYRGEHINQLELENDNNRNNRLKHLFDNYISKQLKTYSPLEYNERETKTYLARIAMNTATGGTVFRRPVIDRFWIMRQGFYRSKMGCLFFAFAVPFYCCLQSSGSLSVGGQALPLYTTPALLLLGLPALYFLGAKLELWRREEQMPKVLDKFLDDMSERQLMRKIGGGYIFRHDYLRQNVLTEELVKLELFDRFGAGGGAFMEMVSQFNSTDKSPVPLILAQLISEKKSQSKHKLMDVLPDEYAHPFIDYAKSNKMDKETHLLILEALLKIGTGSVPPLLMELEDKASRFRPSAIYLLGKMRDSRAVEQLGFCLKEENPTIRKAAAKALKEIGNPEALEILHAMGYKKEA